MPGKGHEGRGIYRTRAETTALKDTVLDAWSAGSDCQACADLAGLTLSYTSSIIIRARKAGDPRAERRRAPNTFDASFTQQEAVLAMHDAGMMTDSIASVIGTHRNRVGETLCRFGLKTRWHRRGLSVAGRGRPLRGTVPSGPGASLPLS